MGDVHFKINMEFVCDMARKMYWIEGKPLKKCLELLYSIMLTDQLTQDEKFEIACLILEGKKVIKGINEGQLHDDDKDFGRVERDE